MQIGDIIAKNLIRLIAEKQTNVSAVARKAGMGHTTVRDIVERRSKNPSYLNLLKIANVLGVHLSDITGARELESLTDKEREMLFLLSQLEPEEREFLLRSAKGIAAAHRSDS